VSENNPNIFVYHRRMHPIGGWNLITSYVIDFEIRDGGLKKAPQLTMRLHNEDGRFTNGTYRIYQNDNIVIFADVGYGNQDMFNGRVFALDPDDYVYKGTTRSVLTVVARGKTGGRMARETSSQPFYDVGWTVSGAFNHMLNTPDSNHATGISLDWSPLNPMASGVYPKNLKQTSLLKAFQYACEEYDYVGWFDDDLSTVYLRSLSNLSGASPSIHYNLSNGLTSCRVKEDVEDVYNHILVWGGTDLGFPPIDLWTEHGANRWVSGWVSNGASVVNATIGGSGYIGDDFLRITKTSAGGVSGYAELVLPNTGYHDPSQIASCSGCMNMNGTPQRFQQVCFFFRFTGGISTFYLRLIDCSGNIAVHSFQPLNPDVWEEWCFNIPSDFSTDPNFLWDNVCRIRFSFHPSDVSPYHMDIDGLSVVGSNWEIDPLLYPNWNPAHVDPISISGASPSGGFGRSVYNHKDDEINCFEQAWEIGESILNKYKNPFRRIEITEGAKIWLHPANTVTVTIPTWGISGATYRVEEVIHRYNAETKLLRTTVSLVEYDVNVPSSIVQREDEGGIWKRPEVA